MSDTAMLAISIAGVDEVEFFRRFDEVAKRFGYFPGPTASYLAETATNEEAVAPAEETLESLPPKRRVRRTKAQIEKDSEAERLRVRETERASIEPSACEGGKADSYSVESIANPEPAVKPTIADVKRAGARLLQADKGDPASLRALLAGYGQTKIAPLSEEHWAEFIGKCDRLVALNDEALI